MPENSLAINFPLFSAKKTVNYRVGIDDNIFNLYVAENFSPGAYKTLFACGNYIIINVRSAVNNSIYNDRYILYPAMKTQAEKAK